LKSLVTEVRMSPWALATEVEEVCWWVKNKGRVCPIESSRLAIPRIKIPEMTYIFALRLLGNTRDTPSRICHFAV
jgi:hypothetical protein